MKWRAINRTGKLFRVTGEGGERTDFGGDKCPPETVSDKPLDDAFALLTASISSACSVWQMVNVIKALKSGPQTE